MTQEEILSYLHELRDKFKNEAKNAMTRDYYIYKEGSKDAIEKVIKKLKS